MILEILGSWDLLVLRWVPGLHLSVRNWRMWHVEVTQRQMLQQCVALGLVVMNLEFPSEPTEGPGSEGRLCGAAVMSGILRMPVPYWICYSIASDSCFGFLACGMWDLVPQPDTEPTPPRRSVITDLPSIRMRFQGVWRSIDSFPKCALEMLILCFMQFHWVFNISYFIAPESILSRIECELQRGNLL